MEDCNNGQIYYVGGPIISGTTTIATGTTFQARIDNQVRCVTYTEDIAGSPSNYLNSILATYGSCVGCVTPTPTPTPTATPTPTPTSSPTPTPVVTYEPYTQFVFTGCNNNLMIVQDETPPSNVNIGDVIKDQNIGCFTYIGFFVRYSPPSGYKWSNQPIFTASTATTYVTCLECLTPTPTPTFTYKSWSAQGGFSVSCPVCQLTDGGTNLTFYTSSTVDTLQTGNFIYQDSSLTEPIIEDYIRYNGFIYSVDVNGQITQFCRVNGNC